MGPASLPARRATLVIAVLLGLPVAASAQPPAVETGVAQPATPGFEILALLTLPLADFEVPADIAAKVRLADGVLWLPPSQRWLLAPRLHDDVLVRLQFKPSADAAVGVLIRGFLDARRTRVQRGYELWLPPPRNGNGRFVVVHMGETRDLDFNERANGSDASWADTWHSLVVEARRDQIDVVLDNKRVFLGEAATPLSGVIGLRVTGGPVEWREAFLRTRTEAEGFPGVPTAGRDGVPVPKLRREVKPRYTHGAMYRRVEGEVWMVCVVRQDGTVGDVRIASSLDPELDEQALIAARQWRFEPARRDGKPIAVVVTISMGFRLEK
jgi:protein TonB